ncbi:MAG: murein biosynthesis integral membrane protein MurJ [Deltaproteobacteria bacterium]|nr:murein biosynthesis integral membrane protein MurJ [Deltaproteobacteria bacterium]
MPSPSPRSSGIGALLVAAGIMLSRLAGLIRERAFAHAFGSSDAADVFRAALRIPNLLQNLFGEGVLSASFIPVYSELADRDRDTATRIAGAVLAVLSIVTSILVVIGVLTAPWLLDLIAPGFEGEKREVTVRLVRILFPGVGVLVFSSWCLGILNSHRKLFVSYVAPVAWNAAIIVAILWTDNGDPYSAVEWVAYGAVVGSLLQLIVQLPFVVPLVRGLRPSLDTKNEHFQAILRNFLPVAASRGVVQVSAYVESLLGSLLPTGAIAALGYGQLLYTLPVSLFGMSVAAAELPEMSRVASMSDEDRKAFAARVEAGSRRIAFFIIPSAAAFVFLGDVICAVLFQTGKFTREDGVVVWSILAASGVGLYASTQGRLVSSAFASFRDTKTPLRFAIARVSVSIGLGVLLALYGPNLLGVGPLYGVAGLALGSSAGALLELLLLRRALRHRIEVSGVATALVAKLCFAAAVGAALAWAVKLAASPLAGHPVVFGGLVLTTFGAGYAGLVLVFGIPEAKTILGALRRRLRI